MKQIITIGREFGSGGHEIGEKLAKKLGYAFYDKEILSAASRKLGVCEALLEESDETQITSLLYSIVTRSNRADSFEQKLIHQENRYLRQQAEKGSCVIIGRCANFLFQDDPAMMSVFITAPLENRIQRISEMYQLTPEEAKRRILMMDKKRANYYSYRTGAKWGDIGQYQLVIDRTLLGVDKTVDILAAVAKSRDSQ